MLIEQFDATNAIWIECFDAKCHGKQLCPGDTVKHLLRGGFGTIISTSKNVANITILWSVVPFSKR